MLGMRGNVHVFKMSHKCIMNTTNSAKKYVKRTWITQILSCCLHDYYLQVHNSLYKELT